MPPLHYPEYNSLAVNADSLVLGKNRPDLILLYDALREAREKDPTGFAERQSAHLATIEEYNALVQSSSAGGPNHVLDRAGEFLKTKFGYAPSGQLELAVYSVADGTAFETARQLKQTAWGDTVAAQNTVNTFATQLEAVHRACELAKTDAFYRQIFESSLSQLANHAFRVTGETVGLGNLESTLALIEQANRGEWTPAFTNQLADQALTRGKGIAQDAVQQFQGADQAFRDAYRQLKAKHPGWPKNLLAREAARTIPVGAKSTEELARQQRVFTNQVYLAFAAKVATFGGDPKLANQIIQASEIYTKTETFLSLLSNVGGPVQGEMGGAALTAAATLNWVGLAMGLMQMSGGLKQGPSEGELILRELEVVKTMIKDLGDMMNRRFDALGFKVERGFTLTLQEIAQLNFTQQNTLLHVRRIEARCAALQQQLVEVLDRTGGKMIDLSLMNYINWANRDLWSPELAGGYADTITLITVHSRNKLTSDSYNAGTAKGAGGDLVSRYSSLGQGRISAPTVGENALFSYGNFLHGYFESRYRTTLTAPASGVPNYYIWLRGVGLLEQMRTKFPQLRDQTSLQNQRLIVDTVNEIETFWNSLAQAKVRHAAKSAYTFKDSLFDGVLQSLDEDFKALTAEVKGVRQQAKGLNQGFDCWGLKNSINEIEEILASNHIGLAPDSLKLSVSQADIPALDAASVGVAMYRRKGLDWEQRAMERFRAALPQKLYLPRADPDRKPHAEDVFKRLFTNAEIINHLFSGSTSQLQVKLISHGWVDIDMPAKRATWLIRLGLYRDDELLRVVHLEQPDLEFTRPPDPGIHANTLFLRSPTEAHRFWSQAVDALVISNSSDEDVKLNRVAFLTGPTLKVTVTPYFGGAAFYPEDANPAQVGLAIEQDGMSNAAAEKIIAEQRATFMHTTLKGSPNLTALLEKYEEDRIALLVLLNFAAPHSWLNNRKLNWWVKRILPPSRSLIHERVCITAGGTGPQESAFALAGLRDELENEYRTRPFPQTPEYLTLGRLMFKAQMSH